MNYYLTRSRPSHRWTLCQRPFSAGETLGPYTDYAATKAAQAIFNAAIPPRPKKPGGGRIAKPHVRHNLTIRADLSERLVKTAEKDGVSVTAVVERLIEKHLKMCLVDVPLAVVRHEGGAARCEHCDKGMIYTGDGCHDVCPHCA